MKGQVPASLKKGRVVLTQTCSLHFVPSCHHLGPTAAEIAGDLLPSLTPLALLPGIDGKTYTEEPPLAPGVAKHFIHWALVEWVDSLAGQFVGVQQVQWVAGLCCNEDIREQEEHPVLQFFSLWRHHQKPAFTDIPAPWACRGNRDSCEIWGRAWRSKKQRVQRDKQEYRVSHPCRLPCSTSIPATRRHWMSAGSSPPAWITTVQKQ